MPTKIESALRRFSWESSRRAERTSEISDPVAEKALSFHIAGEYEKAIALLLEVPEGERSAGVWRVLGHVQHAQGNFRAALVAHGHSFNLHADNPTAASDDQVNVAAVLISMHQYADAWLAVEKARELAPASPSPWLPLISILNRQNRKADLERYLRELVDCMPTFVSNSRFTDHLDNDADFTGVAKILENIRREK